MAKMSQHDFLAHWAAEQFPLANPGALSMTASSPRLGSRIADVLTRYYNLNFIRKPEFMGFNGYNDGIKRTDFNPFAWPSVSGPGQNHTRAAAWSKLREDEQAIAKSLPPQDASAFFELAAYPIEASASQNEKLLATDLTYLDAHNHDATSLAAETAHAHAAYETIQSLTAKYNSIENGKWDGMMSDAPRKRPVFEMPRTATLDDADKPLPASWSAGDPACQREHGSSAQPSSMASPVFTEQLCTVSINAAHFTRKSDASGYSSKLDPAAAQWHTLADLGISGASVVYGSPGLLANAATTSTDASAALSTSLSVAPWLEYDFTTTTNGPATLALHLLPTFPVDSDHRLRYAVSLDGAAPIELDAAAPAAKASANAGDGPASSGWAENVLRNSAAVSIPLGTLSPRKHTLRLLYRDPGVVFEHLVLTFPGAPPAYPVPPETR
jgi:hypothetical protein